MIEVGGMIGLDAAREATLSRAWALPEETVALQEAVGRFLGQDLRAASDSPRFDNSAVDGYAVRASETQGANPETPRTLKVQGTVAAGNPWKGQLSEGSALRIMTGAALPAGADAIVMQEDTQVEGADVVLSGLARAGDHVRRLGQEFRAGDLLLRAGTQVTAPVVALLASQGLSQVNVRRVPRVVVVTTGTEVVAPGETLGPGQIYDSNREGLLAALGSMGIRPISIHRCPDDFEAMRDQCRRAFHEAEVVITTGGVSVGAFDFVRDAAVSAGLHPVFWKIAVKPGKPTFFGTFPRTDAAAGLLFGLPGNPVGALLSFQQLVRPVLERMMGSSGNVAARFPARLTAPLRKPVGRLELVRGRLRVREGALEVEPLSARESHMILGLARADCVLRLSESAEFAEKGSTVEVEVLRWT